MIATPLDSAKLDSKEQYEFYHRMVDFTIKELIVKIQQQKLCNDIEIVFFKQYCDLLLYSINAMRIKYKYDDEDHMKIDLTDSGFPNYLEFRYLFNDLALREEYLNKLTSIDVIKEEFLDTLLRQKEPIKANRLFQAASIVYYSSVKQEFIFNKFVQGKILKLENSKDYEYVTSWSFYDVSHNRPFICFMYFNYDGRDATNERSKIYEALKQSADREINLDAMAYAIDRKLSNVFPKYIKRIDIGPLHNVFAKDENEITHAILESIASKEIPLESFAFALKVDSVKSVGEFKEGSFFSKQTLQKWQTVEHSNYVFAPHRIIQLLHNKTAKIINKLTMPPVEMAEIKN